MGQNILFKETEVLNNLGGIEACLNIIKKHIEDYSAKANCLGESTFRPEVEAQLQNLKSFYIDSMIPPIEKLIEDLQTVMSGYKESASEASDIIM